MRKIVRTQNLAATTPSLTAWLLQRTVRLYQLVFSPFLGAHCRFHPTCSAYLHEALGKYGAIRGVTLGLSRVSRCHPWCAGGFDPVPTTQHSQIHSSTIDHPNSH